MTAVAPLTITHVSPDDLRSDPANPRRIADDQLDALTRSLSEFGLVQPVVARGDDRVVIAGHQRLVAARRLGHPTVPVIFVDLPPDRARLLGLALNRISGTWDEQLLGRLLDQLNAGDVDLRISGFADDELKALLRSIQVREKRDRPESFDLEEALAEVGTRTKLGDLWQLGEHRLLCGDATDAEHVARLLGPARPRMAFTDPPYNVDYGRQVVTLPTVAGAVKV